MANEKIARIVVEHLPHKAHWTTRGYKTERYAQIAVRAVMGNGVTVELAKWDTPEMGIKISTKKAEAERRFAGAVGLPIATARILIKRFRRIETPPKMVDLGQRWFKCLCEGSFRLNKAEWAKYCSGEAVAVKCEHCGFTGEVSVSSIKK